MVVAVRNHFKLIGGYRRGGAGYCWPALLVSLTAVTIAACTADMPPPAAPTQISRPIPGKPARAHHQPVTGNPATAAPGEVPPEAPPAQSEVPAAQSEALAEEPAQTTLAAPSPGDLIGLDEQRTTALLGPAAAMEARAPATVWYYPVPFLGSPLGTAHSSFLVAIGRKRNAMVYQGKARRSRPSRR
jgi:hypothetical protein